MQNLKKAVLILALFALTFGLAYFGKNFLIPIALAGVFALMVMPISRWLERKNFPHWLATLLPVLMLFLILAGLIFVVSLQIKSLSGNFDEMQKRFTEILHKIQSFVSGSLGIDSKQQSEMISNQTNKLGGFASKFVTGFTGILIGTLIVTIYTFFLLHMRHHFKLFILKLIPAEKKEKGREIIKKTSFVAPQYIGGLSIMIVCLWVLYGIGFSIVGLQGAIVIAILCGVLEIIPFVGNLVGTSIAALMVLAQGGDGNMLLGVGIVYLFVQVLQGNVLQPMIVGDKVNINPFFTIAALFLGEMIWGIAGMLLALPILGMIKKICDNIPSLEPYGFLIGSGERKEGDGFGTKVKNRILSIFGKKKLLK